MSPLLAQATVAIEDKRFYSHSGVDYEGILRAAVKNLQEGEIVQGGSTLTQQLVRNLYMGATSPGSARRRRPVSR